MNKVTMLKMFGTGQITIPKAWREKFQTDSFVAMLKKDSIELRPIKFDDDEDEEGSGWVTVWDYQRDKSGKGLPLEDFIAMIKKSIKEDGK